MYPDPSPSLDTALATVVICLLERDGIAITLHDDRVEVTADDLVIFEAHGAFSPWDIMRALHLPPGDGVSHINDERTEPVPAAALTVRYYRSAVACCDDRPPTDPGSTCPACARRQPKGLRVALYECGHGNEIRTFYDSPEIACLDCGLRFCTHSACENAAVHAGIVQGLPLYCGHHSPKPTEHRIDPKVIAAIRALAAWASKQTAGHQQQDSDRAGQVSGELNMDTDSLDETAGRQPVPIAAVGSTYMWSEAAEAFNDAFDDLDRVEQSIGELVENPANDLDELLQLRGKFLAGISVLRRVADVIEAETP
jgi:hypothetical protein